MRNESTVRMVLELTTAKIAKQGESRRNGLDSLHALAQPNGRGTHERTSHAPQNVGKARAESKRRGVQEPAIGGRKDSPPDEADLSKKAKPNRWERRLAEGFRRVGF